MTIQLKYHNYDDTYTLDVPQLVEFRKLGPNVPKHHNSRQKYLRILTNYLNWFVSYSDALFKGKTYSDELIFQTIYTEHKPNLSDRLKIDITSKNIYVCKQYVDDLLSRLTVNNIGAFEYAIWDVCYHIEGLVLTREKHLTRNIPYRNKMRMTCSIKPSLATNEIFNSAKAIFNIENLTLGDLYLMDFKPTTMLLIRQTIELYGKRLLGFCSITDNNGIVSKKNTQVSWKFIKEKNNTSSPIWHISFPFDIQIIALLNTWANHYVHTGEIAPQYRQYFAIKYLEKLFIAPQQPIQVYTGHYVIMPFVPCIEIYGYDNMKADFETYLGANTQVQWDELDNVKAYIKKL